MNAGFWKSIEGGNVSCSLCFHHCIIKDGYSGVCGVRFNVNGTLISPYLGKFCACAVDPVEKKPLHHWRPGSRIYSLGSLGCNMCCPFCQNHHIAAPSDQTHRKVMYFPELSPEELVLDIKELGLKSIAFTYNEPTMQTEYICSSAPLLREAGIALVLVTNGAMSTESARELISCMGTDGAANIDLKAFDPKTYRRLGGNLETVKANITAFVRSGLHVELTNLVVPGINDSKELFCNMVEWIASISPSIPLHITRYFPAKNYHEPPTSIELLYSFASIAEKRLKYVHIGNV